MSAPLRPVENLLSLLELDPVKPDAWLGAGPVLGWGRLYGGQVVAQALRAAGLTVEPRFRPHSLHSYFVRAGDERRSVLYEVERVRDGRSFCTRQVVAYQAGGAILNLIASFQVEEDGADVQQISPPPGVGGPEELPATVTDLFMDHRTARPGPGARIATTAWVRVPEALGEDPLVHACAFAYVSDEDPLGVALLPHPASRDWEGLMAASLDHALWFHRPFRADSWLLVDLTGHGVANARGLALARVFDRDGRHVATVAQEGLVRPRRPV